MNCSSASTGPCCLACISYYIEDYSDHNVARVGRSATDYIHVVVGKQHLTMHLMLLSHGLTTTMC